MEHIHSSRPSFRKYSQNKKLPMELYDMQHPYNMYSMLGF